MRLPTRLFQLKQRTLPWCFEIRHLPGKSNHAADAVSRNPSPSSYTDSSLLGSSTNSDLAKSALRATIYNDTRELGTLSWSLITKETALDTCSSHLLNLIKQGDPILAHSQTGPSLEPFWPICESVHVQEGVLLYQDRVIIPLSLRHQVLQHLHAAHNGTRCPRTFVTSEKHAQTVIGMHPHRQPHPLSHLHPRQCHSKLFLQTSSRMVVISIL